MNVWKRLATYSLTATALTACEALLTEPAAVSDVTVEVAFDSTTAWGIREVWLRLGSGGSTRDTVVLGRIASGTFLTNVRLRPEELVGEVQIQVEVRLRHGLPLFSGTGSIDSSGPTPTVRIHMVPETVVAALIWGREAIAFARPDGSFRSEFEIALNPEAVDTDPRDGSLIFEARRSPRQMSVMDSYRGDVRGFADFRPIPMLPHRPRYSRDGEWVYFGAGQPAGIWRVRSDQTDPEELISGSAANPEPSPNGREVVYRRDPGELWILDLQTRAIRYLVDASSAVWSPDGQWIAFYRDERLGLVRPDGSQMSSLAPTLPIRPAFDWTHDGTGILAATTSYNAVRIDVATGYVEVLPGLGPVHAIAVAP